MRKPTLYRLHNQTTCEFNYNAKRLAVAPPNATSRQCAEFAADLEHDVSEATRVGKATAQQQRAWPFGLVRAFGALARDKNESSLLALPSLPLKNQTSSLRLLALRQPADAAATLAEAAAAAVKQHADSGRQDFAPAAAAGSPLIVLVRLILTILICVLLVKLRAPKRAKQRVAQQFDSAQRQQEDATTYSDLQKTISACGQQQSAPTIRRNQSTSQISSALGGTDTTTIKRRYSQQEQTSFVPSSLQERRDAYELKRRQSDSALANKLQLPPGPTGLPFLGYLPFLGNEIHLTLTKLSNKFGPIYQIFLGNIRVVVLNDAALVRQAFKQTVFSGRPDTQLTRILQGYGIVNSEGALWKEQRAFLHSALRKLGAKSLMSGTNGLEAKIQNQVREFVNDLSGHANEGKPCQVRPIVARAVSSVVGSIVMNLTYRKFEEKEKFDRVIELMQEGFRLVSIAMPLDFIPIFRFFPGVSYAFKKIQQNRTETSTFFQDVADEHRKYLSETFNLNKANSTSSLHPTKLALHTSLCSSNLQATPQSQQNFQSEAQTRESNPDAQQRKPLELEEIVARDLVDAYIVQQKKHEKDGKENYFSDQQLVQIMSDIFSAGLETVTSTIEWSILFLILNLNCQREIQDEIDRVIGRSRSPKLDDLAQMPYTEATIYEVLRRSNVVSLGNAHATLADASIGGYLIPKGTQVLPNLYGIHMDPKLWHEPDRFDPSRFIVNEKAKKPDYFIPFSVGRRMCLGDVLAKMEVFLFLVGLLQRYDLNVHADDAKSPPQVKGTIGVSNSPVSFRVALSLRPDSCADGQAPLQCEDDD